MNIDVQIYQTAEGKQPFAKWLKKQPNLSKAIVAKRIIMLKNGHLGDYRPTKGVKGVFELRMHQGPGYRVYFGKKGQNFVLLLCGGIKGSQTSDIEKAVSYWEDWKMRS